LASALFNEPIGQVLPALVARALAPVPR